ncbi:MAG: hypothetical protein WCB58_05665 [Acidobacteriaceae bacterium]
MYPECRHVRPSGGTCNSPALKGSHWCYFHARIQQRQAIRHSRRRADGRFIALPAPQPEGDATIDYGTYPVAQADSSLALATGQTFPLDLPPLIDNSSIQLALSEIVQALAANEVDTKRAGLLLYALQVASANVKDMHIPYDSVRTVTYTDDGTPLAPQDYGMDVEDYEEEEDEYEDDSD